MLKKNELIWRILLVCNALLLLLLLARPFFCINMTDEVFNIEESFCILQGTHFLVDNWGYYQTGDLFLLPFLKLYYSIVHSTEGIVLYTRICFVLIQIGFSVLAYKILSPHFGRISSFLAVWVYSSTVVYKIFNFWYDTWENLFRVTGFLLIFHVLTDLSLDRRKQHYVLMFIAGILHAFMVFSYPTMVIVYLFVLVLLAIRRKWDLLLTYISGSLFVFAIFVVYVLHVGIDNIGIISKVSFSNSGRGNMFDLQRLMILARDFVVENLSHYRFGLLIFALDLIVFFAIKKTGRYKILFCSIAILGCFVHILENYFDMLSLHTMMTYISFYVPLLYSLSAKQTKEKREYRLLILLFFAASYVAGIAYTVTALFGPVKFGMGARTGAIAALILLAGILKDGDHVLEWKNLLCIFSTFLVGFNLLSLYYSSSWGEGFIGTRPLKCDYAIGEGIFKGILESRERGEMYVRMEKGIRKSIKDGDRTIACGFYAIPGYLMSDLVPDTNNMWESDDYEALQYYFDCYYGYPDIFVINDEFDEYTDPGLLQFISENYDLDEDTGGFLIYHLREKEIIQGNE